MEVDDYDVDAFQTEDDRIHDAGAVWCYGAPRVEVDDYDVDAFQTEDDRIHDAGAVWCYGGPRVKVEIMTLMDFRRRTIEYMMLVLFGVMVVHV